MWRSELHGCPRCRAESASRSLGWKSLDWGSLVRIHHSTIVADRPVISVTKFELRRLSISSERGPGT